MQKEKTTKRKKERKEDRDQGLGLLSSVWHCSALNSSNIESSPVILFQG